MARPKHPQPPKKRRDENRIEDLREFARQLRQMEAEYKKAAEKHSRITNGVRLYTETKDGIPCATLDRWTQERIPPPSPISMHLIEYVAEAIEGFLSEDPGTPRSLYTAFGISPSGRPRNPVDEHFMELITAAILETTPPGKQIDWDDVAVAYDVMRPGRKTDSYPVRIREKYYELLPRWQPMLHALDREMSDPNNK